MIHIPSDHFSLPVDTIVKTLPMMSNVMQPEDIDGWLTKLRDNKAIPHLADLPASRPSDFNNNVKLPGIGHPYWKNARDHILQDPRLRESLHASWNPFGTQQRSIVPNFALTSELDATRIMLTRCIRSTGLSPR